MYRFFKAVMDRVLSFLGLTILLLPLIIVAIAIKLDSKGPAIFKQERIGKNQKPFMLYKFRTMTSTTIKFDIDHPVIEDTNKSLTRVGKVIRKLKIDELLQLINVLKGDMSLIGPRPLMSVYLERYEKWETQKFDVKPGMSGLSQVKGNGYLSSIERSYYDVQYTRKIGLFLDAEILFKTVGVMLAGEDKFMKNVPDEEIERMRKEYAEKHPDEACNDEYAKTATEEANDNAEYAEPQTIEEN